MDSMFQPWVDKLRPTVQSAGERAEAWAHRIVSRLDAIADAVEEDATIYWRERPTQALVAGVAQPIPVPAGEVWTLESVTLVPGIVGTPGSVTLGVSAGLPMWGGAHAGRPVTIDGMRVRFESGTTIQVTAGEVDTTVAFQFRVERPHRPGKGVGGVIETPTDGSDATPNPEPWRHTGSWATA